MTTSPCWPYRSIEPCRKIIPGPDFEASRKLIEATRQAVEVAKADIARSRALLAEAYRVLKETEQTTFLVPLLLYEQFNGLDGQERYYLRGLGPDGSAGDGGHGDDGGGQEPADPPRL